MKRKLLKLLETISEIMAAMAIVAFALTLEYAFLMDGDAAPSRETIIGFAIGGACAALSVMARYVQARIVRREREKRYLRRRMERRRSA